MKERGSADPTLSFRLASFVPPFTPKTNPAPETVEAGFCFVRAFLRARER